jgi:SPP1 gp7 family putative phage head morphogenesis protein
MPDSDAEFLFGPSPHHEAIDFIRSKPVVSREVLDGLLPELKPRVFTISGVEVANIMQEVRDRIAEVPEGADWDEAKKDILPKLSPFFVDPAADAEMQKAQQDAAERRAELLLRTHCTQAYSASQWRVMQRQKDVFPYWQYVTMEDDHVRPEHAALDQIVLPADDPFWEAHYPPWDWGCRCQVISKSAAARDELAAADKDRAPDNKLVLEGTVAEHLRDGTLVRDGRTYDVRPPTDKEGGSGYRWDPGSFQLPLEQLKDRYDGKTWSDFQGWAEKTPLGESYADTTVWDWLNGKKTDERRIEPPAVSRRSVTPPAVPPDLQKQRAPAGYLGGATVNHIDALRSAGLDVAAGGTPQEILSFYNRHVNLDPVDFRHHMLKGLTLPQDTRPILQFDIAAQRLNIAVDGPLDAGGEATFTLCREIDFAAKSVYHAYFQVKETGTSAGKKVLSNFADLYDHWGIKKITVTANIDVGGYAWLRYGFRPVLIPQIQKIVHDSMVRLGAVLSPAMRAVLEACSRSHDPEDFVKLAGMRSTVHDPLHPDKDTGSEYIPLGKAVFLGSWWNGMLDLNNQDQYEQFAKYIGRK